jgi:hypothetical protein
MTLLLKNEKDKVCYTRVNSCREGVNVMKIDFIIPSYHSRELTSLCLMSFEKYKGQNEFNYIVVENSTDTSYKEDVLSISDNIKWVQNPTDLKNSEANAIAIEKGLPYVQSEYVFICHNDVVACRENWLDFLIEQLDSNTVAAGYVLDNCRIGALHISGMLVKTKIAKSVDMRPVYDRNTQVLDVGDSITQYCRDNDLKYFSCKNTHNDESLQEDCEQPYKSLQFVDRAFDSDDNVIFLHLGRGTPKTLGSYWKSNRMGLKEWVGFVKTHILS